MKRRGFTLLELLIVLAIVALLAGLVATAAMTARKKARATECASNLRQLGIGMQMYASDFQGIVLRAPGYLSDARPTENGSNPGAFHYMSWAQGYARYLDPLWGQRGQSLETFKMTKCPEHPIPLMETHFVVNAASLDDSLRPSGSIRNLSALSQIRNPAGVLYLADAMNRWFPPNSNEQSPEYVPRVGSAVVYSAAQLPGGAYQIVSSDRHGSGTINGLFFDGHVETVFTRGMTLKLWDDGIR
jgi:prepilin-type N-terminal cleavage/methylation domain-containing protein/prepilin-type processing-associated H-X9-DG protein